MQGVGAGVGLGRNPSLHSAKARAYHHAAPCLRLMRAPGRMRTRHVRVAVRMRRGMRVAYACMCAFACAHPRTPAYVGACFSYTNYRSQSVLLSLCLPHIMREQLVLPPHDAKSFPRLGGAFCKAKGARRAYA